MTVGDMEAVTMVDTSSVAFGGLARRARGLAANPISAANAEAAQLRRAGYEIVNFSIGEPDFETPGNIKEAGIAAIRRGETRYTIPDGMPQLKEAVCAKFERESGLQFSVEEVSVGAGAKQVIYNAMQATLDQDDEVVIPAPYWTSYPEIVRLCGGEPVVVECLAESRFKLHPEQLSSALSPRTKWVLLNSPSNPSGAVYSRDELRALSEVLLRHPEVMVLTDDIYEHLVYDAQEFVTIASVEPGLLSRTLVVNGVSKTYAMTGWRIGYGAGPTELIRAMGNIQAQTTSAPCSISQAAAVEALTGPQDEVSRRRDKFRQRRDAMVDLVSRIPGLDCTRPEGAFYLFVGCHKLIGRRAGNGNELKDDVAVASYLLREAQVAVVPGVAFGLSPFLRLSYATTVESITEGCERIARALSRLR